jgi:hypothetical protein
MDITQGAGAWKGIWEVTVSPNGVAVWGGDQINCATRSDLDYLCYFGDKIELKKTSVNNTPTTPGPAVTWQSTFTEKIEGGKQLVIKGRLLAGTNKVVIGGKEAKIVSVANDQVVVILPPNPVGEQSLTLSFADQTFKYDSIIRYSTASISESASTARPPVTVTIGGFPDGSPKLTNIIKSRIRAFIKKYGDYKTIECVGYTEGPTVLSTDKALSKSRALNACAYARTGNGLALSVFGIKAGQDTKESSSTRRVVITLRD